MERPHTRLVNSQIPVTLMVAPACERETDIKGKNIRKKIQVTKQPHVKNTFKFSQSHFLRYEYKPKIRITHYTRFLISVVCYYKTYKLYH